MSSAVTLMSVTFAKSEMTVEISSLVKLPTELFVDEDRRRKCSFSVNESWGSRTSRGETKSDARWPQSWRRSKTP